MVERLRKSASQAGMLLSDPPKPSRNMALFNDAATLIQSQAARIAELEAGLRDLMLAEFVPTVFTASDDYVRSLYGAGKRADAIRQARSLLSEGEW